MRAIHPDLIPYVRGFNTARDYIDAMVIERTAAGAQMAHIRQDRGAWAEADGGAAAVDALFTRHDNGDLSLKGTLATVIEHPVGAITYLTTLQQAGRVDAFMLEANAPVSIANVQAYLNPRRDTGQKREAGTWRLRLFGVTEVLGLNGNPAGTFANLVELAEPNDVAVAGDTAGLVTFEYDDQPEGPLPRETRQDSSGLIPGIFLRGMIFGVIYALDANGNTAGNVGMGYDAGTPEVTSGSYKLRGRRLELDTSGNSITRGFWRDEGSSGGTPYVVIETGSFTEETIEFTSGNLFDLGAAPAKDVELVGLVATPPGTSATLRVRNAADTDWVTFTNGQFESEDLGLALIQSKKMQATLTPNAAGNRSPRLRALGRQAIDRIDFSRVATLENYEQAFSPETHKVEIPRPRLVAVKDGQRDFSSKIEKLLAQNFINDIRVRWFVGDAALGRDKWTHMETFLVLDSSPKKPVIELQLVGLCALLKDLAPPFSPGVNYAPDGTQSIGTYTDLAGGTTNIHLGIDEDEPSELDGIRSVTSPVNVEYIWTFPTPSDIAGRRLFIDVDYAKDQAGGEQIDVKFRIYNLTTLVMETALQADVGADRVRKTFELTEAQIAQLTDLPNLRGAIVTNTPAAGVGRRSHLYWARFRSGGRREVVTYLNEPLKDVYDDLMQNRLAIPANLRGPGVEDDTTTVSKQITGLRKRSGGKDVIAKTELEAIAFLADGIILSSEGRIQFAELRTGQPVRAFFPSRRITIGEASPGHEQRIPEFFVPYRWDAEREEFKDEVRAFHSDSILRIGTLGLGPPKWLDEEIAKWIDTDALAEAVGQRTVERLGTGKMLWGFESSDRYPELRVGDLVAVETDLFVSRDPTLDAEVRGRRWAVGPLQRAGKGWSFTIHVRGFADILSDTQAASRLGFAIPDLYEVTPNVSQTGAATAVFKARGAGSVRYAVSTSAEPSAATVRAAAPATLDTDGILRTGTLATLTAGQTLFIAAFGYERGDGTGRESRLATAKITHYEGGVSIEPVETARTAYTITVRMTARDADGDTVKIHYRTVVIASAGDDYASPAPTSEGSFSASPHPLTVVLDRPVSLGGGPASNGGGDRYLECWAEDVNGNKSPIARLSIPSIATADLDGAVTGFGVVASFSGTCPTRNLQDSISWAEGTGVPLAWVAKLYVCTTVSCTPPTAGPFNSNAVSPVVRVAVAGAQAGLNFTANRTYRIRIENGYGEVVDDDVTPDEQTTYNNC